MMTAESTQHIKKVSTTTLRRLNKESIRLGYNRNLTDRFFRLADPDGEHVIEIIMIHEHAMMRPVAPHYRLLLLAKMRRSTEPCHLTLDIPIASWDALPRLPKSVLRRLALATVKEA